MKVLADTFEMGIRKKVLLCHSFPIQPSHSSRRMSKLQLLLLNDGASNLNLIIPPLQKQQRPFQPFLRLIKLVTYL